MSDVTPTPAAERQRRRLPNRRENETIDLVFDGHRYHVTIGFAPDGRPGEVFCHGGKVGPVVTEEGLVGIVSQVDRHTSVAVTWKHPEFRAGAMVAGGTFAGIVEPTRSGPQQAVLLELRGVPSSDTIPAGDEVFTSGGGLLPRGIPLGFVIGVSREEIGWERSYFVRPAVWPEAVSHALVLLDAEQADMSAGFTRTAPRQP